MTDPLMLHQPQEAAAAAPKVVVVMPAYNAGRTLRKTYEALPKGSASHIIVVDDASTDNTVDVARELGLQIFVHEKNYGYGANQKTCYIEALNAGADVIVMVHPDYQYDPTLVPEIIAPLIRGEADVVLGSRLKGRDGRQAIRDGMPWWKWVSNRALTALENLVFGLRLSEYHTGYRAYTREVLSACQFRMNSDGFVFDQDIMAQFVAAGFRIAEVSVPVRYFPEASSAKFFASCRYGLSILFVLFRYGLHRSRLAPSRRLTPLQRRYTRAN